MHKMNLQIEKILYLKAEKEQILNFYCNNVNKKNEKLENLFCV